jgi:uncharacterized protein DUF3179
MVLKETGGAAARAEGRPRGSLRRALALAGLLAVCHGGAVALADTAAMSDQEIGHYALHALPQVTGDREQALQWLAEHADKRAVAALIDLLRWRPDDASTLRQTLQKITGADAGDKWLDWMVWLQEHADEDPPYDGYANFLSLSLAAQDPQFLRFVHEGVPHDIRLEEIVWGGSRVDATPALDNPKMISAVDAEYLKPDDLVFGAEIGGEARAYPLRIVSWHEVVNDVVGGTAVTLAYSPLCNSGILYATQTAGRAQRVTFGASGLVYRSSELLYDRATDSLWNQLTGRPVVGPLSDSDVSVKILPMVLTPWHLWRAKHPSSKVLSIDTGFSRDYTADGGPYRDYRSSKDLLFPVALKNRKAQPKDVVFGLRMPEAAKAWPLTAFAGGKVIQDRVGQTEVVLIGNAEQQTVRAYESKGHKFTMSQPDLLRASDGYWRVTEDALVHSDGKTLARLPGHLAYWFAWSGTFEGALGSN